MKRLAVLVALVVAAVVVVAGAAVAAGVKTSVIYDSTAKNGPPSNLVSAGPEAYAFTSIGDTITFAPGPRKLTNATVTLSSWGCVSGTWFGGDCSTPTGATFDQPITLTVTDSGGNVLASSTQTFAVPYRPSASPRCTGDDAGKWYSSALKTCFNGYATDVTFNFSGNVTLPSTVTYAVSYNSTHFGPNPVGEGAACYGTSGGCPYDSLNVALNDTYPSVGTPGYDADETVFGSPYTPAVTFKAGGGS
jgi:hypothetical protein